MAILPTNIREPYHSEKDKTAIILLTFNKCIFSESLKQANHQHVRRMLLNANKRNGRSETRADLILFVLIHTHRVM